MSSFNLKAVVIFAACGAGLWKAGERWLRPDVEPGKVTILTSDNFFKVRKTAGTLLAIYMRPG